MQRTFWGETQQKATRCQVYLENGLLVFKSPYDANLVVQIKGLPYTERKWDRTRKAWLIDPKHGAALQAIVATYLNEELDLPALSGKAAVTETRLLEVHYLGQAKDRGDGSRSAFAYLETGEWGAAFTEQVLRDWFEAGPAAPDQQSSLYAVLAITKAATLDEVKRGYRRMALQWHPDHCKDLDAPDQFRRITEAYNILIDPGKRARYDAGLALQASLGRQEQRISDQGYRSPLRCGYILTQGVKRPGQFWVEKILEWEDITNALGQILVVSWTYGDKQPTERWC
jgi:DnaJ-domain-containing protein 1